MHCSLTSSAGAERSDGPHNGGLRRAGPNDFMFVAIVVIYYDFTDVLLLKRVINPKAL